MLNFYQIIKNTQEFKRLIAGFFIVLSIFFTLAFSIYYNLEQEKEHAQRVVHSQEEIYQIEKIISLAKDYETSARGFVITNNDIYKEPFILADDSLKKAFAHLEKLVQYDPVQQKYRQVLSEYLQKKIAFSRQMMIVRRERGLAEALQLVATHQGKTQMDNIRKIVAAMQSHEHIVLNKRKKESQRAAFQVNLILLTGLVIFTLLLLYILKRGWYNLIEKKAALEKLKLQEEHFRALIENNSEAIVVRDEQSTISYWSPGAERILGWTKEEILHQKFKEHVHPEDLAQIKRQNQEIFNYPGVSVKGLNRVRHKEGHYVWLEGETINLLHQESVRAIVSNFRDVSARVKADQEVQKANNLLAKAVNNLSRVMDSSPDVICTINAEGKFEQVSAAAATIWGYPPDELIGRFCMDLVAEQDTDLTIQVAGSIMNGIPVTTFENRFIRQDGSLVPLLWSAKWSKEDQLMYCVAKDATEKVQAEKALHVSNYRWENLSKVTFDAVWDWDLKTDDLFWGDNMKTLFGHNIENNKGSYEDWCNNLHPEDKQRVIESMNTFLLGQESRWQEEYRYKKADGEYAFCNDRGILIRDEGGVAYRMIGAIRDVTESKLAEESLLIEKAFSDALLEATPDGIVGFNQNGEIILFNKKAEIMFGYRQKDILGLPLEILLPEENHADHQNQLEAFFAHPSVSKLQESSREMMGLRKDGKEIPVDVRLNFLNTHKGTIILCSIRDITERKLAEKQLKESEKKLKAILSSSQEAIYLLDLNLRLVLHNEHCVDILKRGYGVVCQPGEDFMAQFEPDFRSKMVSIYQKVLGGEKWESDRLIHLPEGDAYYYSNYFPVRDNEGNIIGICCSSKNITERKKIEDAMKIAQAEKEEYQYRFKAILDCSPQAILIKDIEGKHIFSNKAFLNLFDLDRTNEVSKQLKVVFDDQVARTEFLTINQGNIGKLKSREWKQQIILTDKEILELEIIKFPLYDRQNRLFGICTLCKDITEQMQHQQQLILARENAEQAERLQEQFLANMSHELRTPMNGIIGMVNLLLTSSSLQPDQKGRLQVIKRSSDTLLNLINDILDLSKIKAGMLTIEKVNFDFNESIAGTALLFKEKAREKGIKLAVSADPFIPRLLSGDPHRLNQILNNLLSNAIKFTEKGFVRLEASLQSESEEQIVIEFLVSDSGIGIEPGNLNMIFDNFAQASSGISSKYGGTGLGLAITKRLIEMQGGEIVVESTKGKGTTFTFHLPYTIIKDTNAVVNPYYQTTPVPVKKDYSGKRALIVEDNDINQAVLASSLKQHYIDVIIANHGQEAINILESGEQFDIIFMDLRMPVMNGFEATAYIRQKLRLDVPIVVLTASVLRNERDRSLEIGASDYMAKPFAMADLARALEQFVSKPAQKPERDDMKMQETPALVSIKSYSISRLLEMKDTSYIRQIFTLFTETMPVSLAELKSILPTGNWKEFLEKTHKLKGSLATVEITELYQLILRMEEQVELNENLIDLESSINHCTTLYYQTIPIIEKELNRQILALEPNL